MLYTENMFIDMFLQEEKAEQRREELKKKYIKLAKKVGLYIGTSSLIIGFGYWFMYMASECVL